MARMPPELLSSELKENLSSLKESARIIHDTVAAHEPVHNGWGENPLFEEKLKLHKKLGSLVRQQKALAEGIVSLISAVHDFEHEKLLRQKPVLPPAPRPTRPQMSSGADLPDLALSPLPPVRNDRNQPSFIKGSKKPGLKSLFSKS